MKRRKVIFLIALWAFAVAFGLHVLMSYKGNPGGAGSTPPSWPGNKLISLPPEKPMLIMFAHPRCPCTKASLGELELLVAQTKDKFEAAVLFYEPDNAAEDWSETASVNLARSIPGVRVVLDKEGNVARQFAAETSGHTVVYRPDGKLLFAGGITGSRGHMGENSGFDSILKIVHSQSAPTLVKMTKVFGCGLFEECNTRPITQSN